MKNDFYRTPLDCIVKNTGRSNYDGCSTNNIKFRLRRVWRYLNSILYEDQLHYGIRCLRPYAAWQVFAPR